MRPIRILLCVTLGLSFLATGCSGRKSGPPPVRVPELATHDGGFFTIDVPKGWSVTTAGQCSTLAFLLRDPEQPCRQVFFFGQAGPVYLSEQQKYTDQQYVSMGGYNIPWIEMPVVNPLTPENFLLNFHLLAQTSVARQFMPQCPRLDRFQVVSSTPQACPIRGGRTALVRGMFLQDGVDVEGLFMVTVAQLIAPMGGPGSGTGQGYLITGIAAPNDEFEAYRETLTRSVASFSLDETYVRECMRQQDATYAAIMKAGRTLSETSDMIMDGWERRNKVDDIIAAKRSDAILGRERLYDPETREVFEFDLGFYDDYNLNRQKYNRSNLEPLPDNDHDLWTAPALNGPGNIN